MPRPRRLPTVLTSAEATALLRAANPRYRTGHRDRCLMQLMLNVGLRAAEALALTVYDIEWLSGKLTVRQGKGKKDRILWLNEPVLEELRRWRARRPQSANGLLFTTLKGTSIHASALRAMVKRRGHKAGLRHKDVHPHMLRHTFATELYRQTKDIRLVQKALGHSDLSTTMIYTHIVDEDLEAALKGFHLG
jgi:site-specific recombinase XerD